MLKVVALHTGDAHGAHLFPIRQDAHGGPLRLVDGEQGFQLRVGADPVVVAVGADQAPVQTHLPAPSGGDHGQLGGLEVVLDQAVLFVQQLHDVQLDQVAALALQRLGSQYHVQLLTLDALGQGLLHLVGSQVGQQVRDHQHGISLVLADGDIDHGAVLAVYHAVDGQGDGGPLVLLNAAVVVGLEVGNLRLLIERVGLYVQPGRIHMGGADVGAFA